MHGPTARIALAVLLLAAPAAAAPASTASEHKPTQPAPHKPTPVLKPKPSAPGAPPATAPAPAPPAPESPEPQKGSNTGLPLPRFAALRFDEVNLRVGPGTRYPIKWVYKRRDLPVEIQREFEVWRLVRDQEGARGWVHQAALIGRRTAVATAKDTVLRRDPNDTAAPVARLKPGVIVRLRACEAASPWCQASVQDYRGWIKRADIWGTLPGEAIQ